MAERIWQIEINDELVEHLFDASGSETFDATQAVEYKAVDKPYLGPITENDVITFTLLHDGTNTNGTN